MVRAFERSIFGYGSVVGLRSISRQRTPRRPRSMASVRPTGPAPATITSYAGNGVPPSWVVRRLYHPGRPCHVEGRMSGVGLDDLRVCPLGRVLGRHALDRLRVHVDDDVLADHLGGLAVGRPGVAGQS